MLLLSLEGHIKKNYPKWKGKEINDESFDTASVAEYGSYFDADSALFVTANFVHPQDEWILDLGCSSHVPIGIGLSPIEK